MILEIDGRAAYAYTGGKPFDAARPAVVFIHGAEHDHSVWALQTRYFAHHGFAVLALDLPGHGRSDGPARSTVPPSARSPTGRSARSTQRRCRKRSSSATAWAP